MFLKISGRDFLVADTPGCGPVHTNSHGRPKEVQGKLGPLDFEICCFPINVCAEKCFSLGFELVK